MKSHHSFTVPRRPECTLADTVERAFRLESKAVEPNSYVLVSRGLEDEVQQLLHSLPLLGS